MNSKREGEITNWLKERNLHVLEELSSLEPAQNEVMSAHVEETKIVFENKEFSLGGNLSTTLFGVRSIVNNRLGFQTTNNAEWESLKQMSREVQAIARLSPPSLHHQIPTAENAGQWDKNDFSSFEDRLAELPLRDLFNYAEEMMARAQRDPKISIDRAEMSLSREYRVLSNSNDISRSVATARIHWYVAGFAKDGDEVTSLDYDAGTVAKLDRLENEIEASVDRFTGAVLGCLHPTKTGPTYKGKILLHPKAVGELFGSLIAANCNGRAQQDGTSAWKDCLGTRVASAELNVFEDPLDKDRLEGWSPFDREGVLRQKHEILKGGALSFVAHNCFSAHRAGVRPTGNGVGSVRGLPGVGLSNLSFEGLSSKVLPEEELFKNAEHCLLLKAFSGNDDSISGLFSGVAKNSRWVEGGVLGKAALNTMVSGNLFDLLKSIVAIGQESHKLSNGTRAPYILVDGVNVTSA